MSGYGFALGMSNSQGGRMSNNRPPTAFSTVNGGMGSMSSQAPRKSIAMAETDYFKKISIKEFTQNKIAEAARNSMVSPMRGSVTGKQPRQGPYGAKPTMCNERLEMHSETMDDDN